MLHDQGTLRSEPYCRRTYTFVLTSDSCFVKHSLMPNSVLAHTVWPKSAIQRIIPRIGSWPQVHRITSDRELEGRLNACAVNGTLSDWRKLAKMLFCAAWRPVSCLLWI